MSDNVVPHPKRRLMTEADIERKIAESSEAEVLQEDIRRAVRADSNYLEHYGLI